jgi:hypothetical protein
MIKLKTQFKVRIVYKSGHTQDFWCNSFTISGNNGGPISYKWESVGDISPVLLGVDEIAAVWQIATRKAWGTK